MKASYKRITKRTASSSNPAVTSGTDPQLSHRPSSLLDASTNVEDKFCGRILSWELNSEGEELTPLPSVYTTYDQYLQSWEPVVIAEIKANILSSLNSSSNFTWGKFSSSNFVGIKAKTKIQCLNYTVDYSPQSTATESVQTHSLGNMDLILMTYETIPSSVSSKFLLQLRSSTYVLGLVVSAKRNEIQIKVVSQAWNEWMILATQRDEAAASTSQLSFPISYVVLNGLVSSYREYSALFSIQKSPLLSSIIQLPHSPTPPQSPLPFEEERVISDIGTQLYPLLKNTYNSSQLEAIYISSERNQHGITLIQGPPGM